MAPKSVQLLHFWSSSMSHSSSSFTEGYLRTPFMWNIFLLIIWYILSWMCLLHLSSKYLFLFNSEWAMEVREQFFFAAVREELMKLLLYGLFRTWLRHQSERADSFTSKINEILTNALNLDPSYHSTVSQVLQIPTFTVSGSVKEDFLMFCYIFFLNSKCKKAILIIAIHFWLQVITKLFCLNLLANWQCRVFLGDSQLGWRITCTCWRHWQLWLNAPHLWSSNRKHK